jgi:hypothetical protein
VRQVRWCEEGGVRILWVTIRTSGIAVRQVRWCEEGGVRILWVTIRTSGIAVRQVRWCEEAAAAVGRAAGLVALARAAEADQRYEEALGHFQQVRVRRYR